jgi:predicted acetyltransferase
MPRVELERAGPGRRETLANLLQLYTHDFSEQWAGEPHGDLGEDGRFAAYPFLDSYWTEADREPLLIRAEGKLAGFALVNAFAHSGLPIDFSVAEFFVARKYRRSGVGLAAATEIIRARPGQWEIAVARKNLAAQPFWRRVAAVVAVGGIDELDRADDRWNGLILRFRSG